MLMYKYLIFLKKSDDETVLKHFEDFTLKYLSEISGEEVKAASVETNLLLETKYQKFCEITASSKEEMDTKLNSPPGKSLTKDLEQFHEFLTVIAVDYQK